MPRPKGPAVIVSCANCGKQERRSASNVRSKKAYCSNLCRGLGQRHTIERTVELFWSKVDRNAPKGCWLFNGIITWEGYGHVDVPSEGKQYQAHRFAWRLLKGVEPGFLCHTCDIRNCVNPAHLYEGDHATNTDDKKRRDRSGNKLNIEKVAQIKALLGKVPQVRIAEMFGVKPAVISKINVGGIWKHVRPAAGRSEG